METINLPSKIKAIVQSDWQSTKLKVTQIPLPIPKPGSEEHLIQVYATSPCAGELLWVKEFPAILGPDKTLGVPCYDLAGVVITAPPNSPLQPGTEVYTRTNASRDGNAREYTIAVTSELAVKPKSTSWAEAASVPLSAFTAYQALFEHGEIDPAFDNEDGKSKNSKKRVLFTSASGGVGVWLLQLAKAAGVGTIIGMCGPSNIDIVKSLGATNVINYRDQSIDDWFASGHDKVDLVIDAVGGQSLSSSWKVIKEGGILLSVKASPLDYKPQGVSAGIRASFFIMEPHGWQLNTVGRLLDTGLAKPVIDSVWNFESFQKAFDKVDSGHSKGKVIINVVDY
jgi:NADPH:quinone reductase-like Zn-dependent oxidoreductase